jgi:hypothetical protein
VEDRRVSHVIYLYGFVPGDAPAPPAELAGVANAAVRLIDIDGVLAAVSQLPSAAYDASAIEAQLEDLGWVGEQGLAHERVVLWFVDHAQILPARLFTMYSGDAALRQAVAPQAERVAAQLETLGGRREWNLKVAYDATELARHAGEVSDAVRALDDEIAAAAPGRRYLMQRQRADLIKGEVTRVARQLADEMLGNLASHADAVRTLALPSTDELGTVILNAALLVPRDGEQALREDAECRVQAARSLGMIATFTGPWAPYRFVQESTIDRGAGEGADG